MKWIKLGVIFVFLFSNSQLLLAQNEPKPYWIKSTLTAPEGTNTFYVWGEGEGESRHEAWGNAELWAIAKAVGREMGYEVPRTSLDSLRFSNEFRARIQAQASKFRKEQRTETQLIKLINGRVRICVLFEFVADTSKEKKYGTENHYDAECDKDIDRYNKLHSPKNGNWTPIGLKQLQRDRTPWEKTRGSIWLVGQTAGFTGTIVYGCRWASQKKDLTILEKAYENEPYGEARAQIKDQIDSKENQIQNSKLGFGFSVGAMALFYGLNVLDNCVWTKTNKRGVQTSLYVLPNLTTEYNGISVSYNF